MGFGTDTDGQGALSYALTGHAAYVQLDLDLDLDLDGAPITVTPETIPFIDALSNKINDSRP